VIESTGDVEWDIDEFHGDNAGLVVAEAVYIGTDDIPDPQTWEPSCCEL
jgi:CYTH domain-containing protein